MPGNDNTDDIRRRAARIRDSEDDEITAEHYIHAEPGSNITVVTGKHKPVSKEEAEEVTPTDPPRKPSTDPPKSGFAKLKLFDPARIDTAPKAFAFLVLVVAVVVLAIFGPEWVRNVVP